MRLINFISLRLSVLAAVVLAFWSVFFYFAIIDEINDEIDDSLEDYAELIIRKALAGEPLPTGSNGTNNQYYLRGVSTDYADSHDHVRYEDRNVYIKEKREYEPARTISYIYKGDDDCFFEVEVSVPTIDKADLKEAIFYWLLFLYVTIMLGIVLLNLFAVRRSMRPLHNLLAWVDDYRLGRTNRKLLNPTRVMEFRKLNEAVDRLMERSERLYEQQKLFIGNASHEMQTPLAVCQNRLEMLLEDDTLDECQMGEIVKTLNTLGALSKLNRSLLLLCKIDNGQFPDIETIDMASLAGKLAVDYMSVFSGRNITVEQDMDTPWVMDMSGQLATTLVANLLKNAFVHNKDGGRVLIRTSACGMTVANSGIGESLDISKIFIRFYHTPGSRSSSGLGLSLVKAVCDLYSINILYRFENGMHVFELARNVV